MNRYGGEAQMRFPAAMAAPSTVGPVMSSPAPGKTSYTQPMIAHVDRKYNYRNIQWIYVCFQRSSRHCTSCSGYTICSVAHWIGSNHTHVSWSRGDFLRETQRDLHLFCSYPRVRTCVFTRSDVKYIYSGQRSGGCLLTVYFNSRCLLPSLRPWTEIFGMAALLSRKS